MKEQIKNKLLLGINKLKAPEGYLKAGYPRIESILGPSWLGVLPPRYVARVYSYRLRGQFPITSLLFELAREPAACLGGGLDLARVAQLFQRRANLFPIHLTLAASRPPRLLLLWSSSLRLRDGILLPQ